MKVLFLIKNKWKAFFAAISAVFVLISSSAWFDLPLSLLDFMETKAVLQDSTASTAEKVAVVTDYRSRSAYAWGRYFSYEPKFGQKNRKSAN
jgi:hypothetical protein